MQRCREDEERRTEMASHFQAKLTDIQTQIEQHSARNDKLCRENANLTDKLELLVNQCEVRDEVRGGEGQEGVREEPRRRGPRPQRFDGSGVAL